MTTATKTALGIRIIELPKCRMATSKGHTLETFDQWWTEVDRQRVDKFFPRDFMYFDKAAKELVWWYALPHGMDSGKFGQIDFDGGLYAVAISKDQDDVDGEAVFAGIKAWVDNDTEFQFAESDTRPVLFHITTSDKAFAKLKYRQMDIYVPIE